MSRVRLRPAYTPDELAKIYAKPHEHRHWADHRVRCAVTAQFADQLTGPVDRAADLSCGDGAILGSLRVKDRYLGDFAPGYRFCGPIDETIEQIPHVNLFVCCETLEHLDDPDVVLKSIRAKADRLVLSTPIDAWQDSNTEHYWSWDREGVEDMLKDAGFDPAVFMALDFRPAGAAYCYGVWWLR